MLESKRKDVPSSDDVPSKRARKFQPPLGTFPQEIWTIILSHALKIGQFPLAQHDFFNDSQTVKMIFSFGNVCRTFRNILFRQDLVHEKLYGPRLVKFNQLPLLWTYLDQLLPKPKDEMQPCWLNCSDETARNLFPFLVKGKEIFPKWSKKVKHDDSNDFNDSKSEANSLSEDSPAGQTRKIAQQVKLVRYRRYVKTLWEWFTEPATSDAHDKNVCSASLSQKFYAFMRSLLNTPKEKFIGQYLVDHLTIETPTKSTSKQQLGDKFYDDLLAYGLAASRSRMWWKIRGIHPQIHKNTLNLALKDGVFSISCEPILNYLMTQFPECQFHFTFLWEQFCNVIASLGSEIFRVGARYSDTWHSKLLCLNVKTFRQEYLKHCELKLKGKTTSGNIFDSNDYRALVLERCCRQLFTDLFKESRSEIWEEIGKRLFQKMPLDVKVGILDFKRTIEPNISKLCRDFVVLSKDGDKFQDYLTDNYLDLSKEIELTEQNPTKV